MDTVLLLLAGFSLIGISIASTMFLMKPSEMVDIEEGAVQHKVNNINIDDWNKTIPAVRKDKSQDEGTMPSEPTNNHNSFPV